MAGKSGRKGNGESSLRQRADGRWEARLSLPSGRAKSLYARTRAEAARKLAAFTRDRDHGLLLALDERQTVKQYLTTWLLTIQPTIKPETWQRYELPVRIHLAPGRGYIRLAKLSAQHVQRFYSVKVEANTLAPSTVAYLHAVLHRALDAATRLELISRNPADMVTPPRAKQHEMKFLTLKQAQALLIAVHGDRLEAAYVLSLTLGLCQGELLGLRWQDVDFDTATLRIRNTLHFDKGGVWRLASPKTERSRRSIDLPPLVVEILRIYRKRQLEERLAVGGAWIDHEFVFCNAVGEPLRGTHLLERHFLPLLERSGLPKIRWHDLRHTCVTLAVAQGIQVPTISTMLGHSTVSMTYDVRSHVLPGMQKAATLAIQEALFGGLGSKSGSKSKDGTRTNVGR